MTRVLRPDPAPPESVPAGRRAAVEDGSGREDRGIVLFDPAAELVAAAGALRSAAREPGTRRAIPATLGCVEATLHALASALDAMGDELRDPPDAEGGSVVRASEEFRARRAFDDAIAVLDRAQTVVERAREHAAPIAASDDADG